MTKPSDDRESRLDALREEAARGGGVAASGVSVSGGPMPMPGSPAAAAKGYYGLPVLKAPVWTWEVPAYFFVGGIAGASALIAFAAKIAGGGNAGVERAALWVALIAAMICPALLVADLGRPGRFLNMLRVFKRQSPMSVGAWTLVGFSGAVAVSVAANEAVHAGSFTGVAAGISWAAEAVAAAGGLVLLSYTAVLLGVTAIPIWSENRNVLAPHFVASGIGSASAVLELLGFLVPATQWLGLAASAWETLVGGRLELRNPRIDRPLRRGSSGWTARAGGALAGPVALALRIVYGARSVGGREFAAVCFLTGALLTRYAWVLAGRASANDPQALFELQKNSRSRV